MATSVILVDDHRLVRQGLKGLLEKQKGVKVVAEAEDGRTAVRLARKLSPDVVVMDVSMPGLNGVDATRQIVAGSPRARVIALSMHSDRRLVAEMLRAGACGYLLKHCAFEELLGAISTVMRKETYLSPAIAGVLVDEYVRTGAITSGVPLLQAAPSTVAAGSLPAAAFGDAALEPGPRRAGPAKNGANAAAWARSSGRSGGSSVAEGDEGSVFSVLTPREREVLQLVGEGNTTKQIARDLHLSPKTVDAHRRKLMEKLGLFGVADLTRYAVRQGLVAIEC